jgi:threonine synthase
MPQKSRLSRIIAVDGHPIDVKTAAEDFATCMGFPKISPFYERCEANKTIAYELAEDLLMGRLPQQDRLRGGSFEFYAQTLSAGMGLIGYHAAMEYLQRWTDGKLRVPRMVAIEISEFAPVQKAWEQGVELVGEEVATPFFPNHPLFEPTLWTTNASKYYPHLRRMILASNGMLDTVTPADVIHMVEKYGISEEIRDLGYRLAETEKAPFVGFAGIAKAIEAGCILKGSNIILLITGKGCRKDFIQEQPDCVMNPKLHKPIDIISCISDLQS